MMTFQLRRPSRFIRVGYWSAGRRTRCPNTWPKNLFHRSNSLGTAASGWRGPCALQHHGGSGGREVPLDATGRRVPPTARPAHTGGARTDRQRQGGTMPQNRYEAQNLTYHHAHAAQGDQWCRSASPGQGGDTGIRTAAHGRGLREDGVVPVGPGPMGAVIIWAAVPEVRG